MAKFILLDHSLYGVGGHHYAYAVDVLRAAEAMGNQIVLATHVDFRAPAELPTSWQLLPVFTHDAYSGYSVFSGTEKSLRSITSLNPELKEWSKRGRDWLRSTFDRRILSRTHRRRLRQERKHLHRAPLILDDFVRQCEQVFDAVPIDADDTVFIPTLTEFDLKWVVMFLRQRPNLLVTPWHLQFHFNFLEGREPDYTAQVDQAEAMRRLFAAQLDQLPAQRLFFYTTTRQLSAQYEHLGVGQFHALPYPVKPSFPARSEGSAPHRYSRPLRLTCGGCVRPEKGYEWLSSAIAELWNDFFATGRLQMVIQTDDSQIALSLPGRQKPRLIDRVTQIQDLDDPVVCVPGPLPADEYAQLIHFADIGLLLYDSQRYYTRCSGVLLEMLSAGVPVIVPSGCWLSAQIAEQIYAHLEAVMATHPTAARFTAAEIPWRRTASANGQVASAFAAGGAAKGVTCTLPIPPTGTDLGLTVSWPAQAPPGVFLRLVTCQLDALGNPLQTFTTIIEQRLDRSATPALVHLKLGAKAVQLTLENAFHHDLVELAGFEVCFLSISAGRCPAGAVGLTATGHRQLPELLADLTQNYSHYRATATAFAKQLAWNHRPERTVEALKSNQALANHFVSADERPAKAA